MKSTAQFKKSIQTYLENYANNDALFAQTFAKENKSIDECVSYILNTVKESGECGFEDSEIYGMAIHYYDEDDIKAKPFTNNVKIVVNHEVILSEEDIKEAKERALEEVVANEKNKILYKKTVKKDPVLNILPSLFD